jgi:uncharacterized membrane protein
MTPTPASLLRGLGLVALVGTWAVLAHLGSAGKGGDLTVAVALAPFAALLALLLWRSGKALALAGGSLVAAVLFFFSWPALLKNVALLYYLQHAGANLTLGVLFGRSLFAPREALVTQFARLAHGGVLSATKTRYTRHVTVAWAIFFLLNVLVSTTLFLFAAHETWSIFANLLTMPLVISMFIVEQAVRVRVLPPEDRSGFSDTIRGYRAAMAQCRESVANRP